MVVLLLLLAALPVPSMMELVLDGDVKIVHSSRQGNYTLAEGLVNGFPYWYHQDGMKAIWSIGYSYWMVGDIEDLGKAIGYIAVPFESKEWPTQIIDGFLLFYNMNWYTASLKEVSFKDCKYKI